MVEHAREAGRLFLRKGRIIRAAIDEPALSGAAAVYEMVTWGAGSFDFLAGDVGGVDEIQASTTYLLMEGARRLDEAKAARRARAADPGKQALSERDHQRDIVVPAECGGWRLDHFLKRRIGRMSRTRIQSIIGEQISFPDGRPARPSSPVRAGETILLRRPAPVEPEVPRHFEVLFEDASVLVIDKPAGLPMHTTAKFWRNTLVALLRELYPDEQMEIAHRIDRETSGRAADRAGPRRCELPDARVRAPRGGEDLPGAGQGPSPRRGAHRYAAAAAGHEVTRDDGAGARRRAGAGRADAVSRAPAAAGPRAVRGHAR